MKITKRLLRTSALLVLAGYCVFTTIRVRHLEARLSTIELTDRSRASISYEFDDSFRQHFGQQGVDAVNRAMSHGKTDLDQVLRDVRLELRLQ